MLPMIFAFLILSLIAGLLGFSGVAVISVEIAKLLFIVFFVLFLFSTLVHFLGYQRPPRGPRI